MLKFIAAPLAVAAVLLTASSVIAADGADLPGYPTAAPVVTEPPTPTPTPVPTEPPAPTPTPTAAPTPTPVAKHPNAAVVAKSIKLGYARANLEILKTGTKFTISASPGMAFTISVTGKVGKKRAVVAKGAGTTDAKGYVTLRLKPTAAGKKAAKGKKAIGLAIRVVGTNPDGVTKQATAAVRVKPAEKQRKR